MYGMELKISIKLNLRNGCMQKFMKNHIMTTTQKWNRNKRAKTYSRNDHK